jgi:hypothetical protein
LHGKKSEQLNDKPYLKGEIQKERRMSMKLIQLKPKGAKEGVSKRRECLK